MPAWYDNLAALNQANALPAPDYLPKEQINGDYDEGAARLPAKLVVEHPSTHFGSSQLSSLLAPKFATGLRGFKHGL